MVRVRARNMAAAILACALIFALVFTSIPVGSRHQPGAGQQGND
jgi:hypothetical protein